MKFQGGVELVGGCLVTSFWVDMVFGLFVCVLTLEELRQEVIGSNQVTTISLLLGTV